jgi:hypothetical protein
MRFLDSKQMFKAVRLAERLADKLNLAVERRLSAYFSVNAVIVDEESSSTALKALLSRRGAQADLSEVKLPNQNLSVSHSGNRTLGIDVRASSGACELVGTGLDYEVARKVNPRTARFFLQPAELEWVAKTNKAHRNFHLLRLWTIKEALFKCDVTNRTSSRFLGQYQTDNPQDHAGTAKHPALPDVRFFYATTDLDDGLVSIAVAVRG